MIESFPQSEALLGGRLGFLPCGGGPSSSETVRSVVLSEINAYMTKAGETVSASGYALFPH